MTVIDIVEDRLTQACTELEKEFGGDNILPYVCDVANKEQFVSNSN